MKEELPLVSVILPYHNRPDAVPRALRSVVQQEYQHLEIVLIDDGSDAHAQPSFDEFHGDARIRVLRQPRAGVSAARNHGIRESRGPFIAFLDSDDEWFPAKIERQMSFFRENPATQLCHCEEQWLRDGRRVNPKNIHRKARGAAFEDCLPLCRISPSAAVLRRDLLDEIGLFDERLRVCEDYELWLRVAARYPIGYIEECLLRKYGGHADQLSRSEAAMDRFRVFALLELLKADVLDLRQQRATRACALEKLILLQTGAKKRGNQGFSTLCATLIEHLQQQPATSIGVANAAMCMNSPWEQLLENELLV